MLNFSKGYCGDLLYYKNIQNVTKVNIRVHYCTLQEITSNVKRSGLLHKKEAKCLKWMRRELKGAIKQGQWIYQRWRGRIHIAFRRPTGGGPILWQNIWLYALELDLQELEIFGTLKWKVMWFRWLEPSMEKKKTLWFKRFCKRGRIPAK